MASGPQSPSGALSQLGFDVRFEWGEHGARALAAGSDALVVVDVLSFSTAVDVAVARGAWVYPVAPDEAAAGRLARTLDAQLAVHRSATGPHAPYSLSPPSMAAIQPGTRVVLPSPNGAAVAAAAAGIPVVIAGCLRNGAAVAAHLAPAPIMSSSAGRRLPSGHRSPAAITATGRPAAARRTQAAAARALRSEAPTTVAPVAASADEIADPLGEGSTSRRTPAGGSTNVCGDRLMSPGPACRRPTASVASCSSAARS